MSDSDRDSRQVFTGAALILIGLALLATRLKGLDISVHAWPFIPLVLGVLRLFWPGRRAAVWLLGTGLYGLVSEYRLLGLHYGTAWPLLVIVAGINYVWQAFEPPAAPKIREN